MLAFVSQVLDPKSDTTGSAAVIVLTKVFKDESAAFLASKNANVWEISAD